MNVDLEYCLKSKEPEFVVFTLENGNRFIVKCRETEGMLDISCEGGMVIQILKENRLLLDGVNP